LAAEDVLAQLTDQLTRRKAQLQDAAHKLEQIQQAIDDQVMCMFFFLNEMDMNSFSTHVDHMTLFFHPSYLFYKWK